MTDTDLPSPTCEIASVLFHLSGHLTGLSAQVNGIEYELGIQLNCDAPPQSGTITQLQSLDYLRQSLQDLSGLLLSLSKVEGLGKLSCDQIAQINAHLKLNDTKAILVPQTEAAVFGIGDPSFGDMDLF